MGWSHLNQDRDVTRRCEHGVSELYDSGNFFTVRGTVIFSKRASFSLELVLEQETFGLVMKCP